MKKILFWITTPITFPLVIVFAILQGITEWMQEGLHWWEAWCFDLHKNHRYLGGGIWTDKANPRKWEDH